MSRFVSKETARVDLGGGDFVVIRRQLGYGDRGLVQEKLMSSVTSTQVAAIERAAKRVATIQKGVDEGPKEPLPGDNEVIRLNLRDSNIELLLQIIVAWGGPGFCDEQGQPMPVTADSIDVLDETAERILEEFKRVAIVKTPDFTSPPSPPINTEAVEPIPLPIDASTN